MMRRLPLIGLLLVMVQGGDADAASDIPGNERTRAVLKTGSAGVSGDLFGPGDTDWYRVFLDRGYNYALQVRVSCPAVELRLLDRNGRQLARAEGDYEFSAFLERHISYTGLHYAAVRATGLVNADCDPDRGGTYSGAFSLTAVRECGRDARTRCEVVVGRTVHSRIAGYQDRDWWKVDVPRPDTYDIHLSPPVGQDFLIGAVLSLRRADGSIITESSRNDAFQCGPSGNDGECLRVPLKAGRHYLSVRAPGGGESYRLSIAPTS